MELQQNIDLNADLGEGFEQDQAILALVSSVNIACGGHAGDDDTMRATIQLANQAGVAIGAHPGFEDRERFGRTLLHWNAQQVYDSTQRQIHRLLGHINAIGGRLNHVKPHGALYHLLLNDEACAQAFVDAVRVIDSRILIYTMPFGALRKAAEGAGLQVVCEGFADRRYEADGQLTPRSLGAEALIHEPLEAEKQVLHMIRDQAVQTRQGDLLNLSVQTICVHGDGDAAVEQLMRIRSCLDREHIRVQAIQYENQ